MAYVTAKALQDGPYEVAGGAKILDYTGKEYAESAIDPLYLCRCGGSKNSRFATATMRTSASRRTRRSSSKTITSAGFKRVGILE